VEAILVVATHPHLGTMDQVVATVVVALEAEAMVDRPAEMAAADMAVAMEVAKEAMVEVKVAGTKAVVAAMVVAAEAGRLNTKVEVATAEARVDTAVVGRVVEALSEVPGMPNVVRDLMAEDMAEVVEVKAKVMEADRAEVTLRTDVRTVQTSVHSVVTSADKRQSIVTKL